MKCKTLIREDLSDLEESGNMDLPALGGRFFRVYSLESIAIL
jgi:hypothetical protein